MQGPTSCRRARGTAARIGSTLPITCVTHTTFRRSRLEAASIWSGHDQRPRSQASQPRVAPRAGPVIRASRGRRTRRRSARTRRIARCSRVRSRVGFEAPALVVDDGAPLEPTDAVDVSRRGGVSRVDDASANAALDHVLMRRVEEYFFSAFSSSAMAFGKPLRPPRFEENRLSNTCAVRTLSGQQSEMRFAMRG